MERIGRYRVTRKIGEGGMGVVYAAHDDRLDRPVAIKIVRPDALGDASARQRFEREAWAAARVSHPNICQLYELDEEGGQPFLVMELLDGESLAARLQRGPIPLTEVLALAATMLGALAALHRRGIVHRDLKPANVFLTPYGLKLLDFGLARPLTPDDRTRELALTAHGQIVGTPQYMAPEQLADGTTDERADVFAAGAVIYEMLTGRPAFTGATFAAILHSVGYLDPPPLDGSPELAAINAVLHRAMAKQPSQRIARADSLATMLSEVCELPEGARPSSRTATRLVVLPFRVLRPDPETDFLAFSIADAVSVALATLDSVEVRWLQTRLGDEVDVRAIGRELAVDVVLAGTLLRAGKHVRVTVQLVEVSTGTIRWSDVEQAPIDDLFQLQDLLTTGVVRSLALPLTRRDRQALRRQMPANVEAYELYLRANELATDPARWTEARDAYQRAVALDPSSAPAWARLGRVERVLAKYGAASGAGGLARAQKAFRRAFELDPDLPIAHDLAAYVDAELGHAADGMERLLQRVAAGRVDAGLFAGLVTTCRYAGLLVPSRAAHDRAVALNPTQTTSITWTHIVAGDYRSAIATDRYNPPFGALMALALSGELSASAYRHVVEAQPASPTSQALIVYPMLMEGAIDKALEHLQAIEVSGFADPEGWYVTAFWLARTGAIDPALEYLTRAIDGGYACHEPLTRQPQWTPLRGHPRFEPLVDRTAALVADARVRFTGAGGEAVLGVGVSV